MDLLTWIFSLSLCIAVEREETYSLVNRRTCVKKNNAFRYINVSYRKVWFSTSVYRGDLRIEPFECAILQREFAACTFSWPPKLLSVRVGLSMVGIPSNIRISCKKVKICRLYVQDPEKTNIILTNCMNSVFFRCTCRRCEAIEQYLTVPRKLADGRCFRRLPSASAWNRASPKSSMYTVFFRGVSGSPIAKFD